MEKENIVETARDMALGALSKCSTRNGLYASCGKNGYTSVWARDSMISLIGATTHTPIFEKVFWDSLSTLARHQSPRGQIPNDVDVFEDKKLVTFATIDSSLWFVLGEHFYKERFTPELWKMHRKNVESAMQWVEMQDAGEDMMPEQQPTSDWMDCFPHKYGHTINTQALYYAALKATGRKRILSKFKEKVDKHLWDKTLGYYLPWHWKDHHQYTEKEEWFDSLGNMLAIVFGLADRKQANKILDHVKKKGIARPFPMRAIYPPIRPRAKEWKDYFLASRAGTPNKYINGGIWPFIGGFYVCALASVGRMGEARQQLESLAMANRLGRKLGWDFNEWIDPVTRKASGGRHQAWSAGGYLLAYESVKTRGNPIKW